MLFYHSKSMQPDFLAFPRRPKLHSSIRHFLRGLQRLPVSHIGWASRKKENSILLLWQLLFWTAQKGDDLSSATAKLAAADLFSSSLDLPFEQEAYSGSFATQIGREFLSTVTAANQPSENDADDTIMRLFSSAGQIPAGGEKPVLTFVSPDFVKLGEDLESGSAVFRAETTNNIEFSTFRIGGQDAEAFSVDRNSGIVSLIREEVLLDREVARITITATDAAGNSATQAVTIVVAKAQSDLPLLGLLPSNDQARLGFAPDYYGSNSTDDISTGLSTADDDFIVDTIGIVPPQATEVFF
jgi:hypothetical protein